MQGIVEEAKMVSWPSVHSTVHSTTLVLLVVAAAAILFSTLDAVLAGVADRLYG